MGSNTEFAFETAGYLCLLIGLSIRMWSILYIGGRKSRELITEGPYSLCRNPLYVGTFFLTIGAGLCFENIPMLVATLIIFLPVHMVVIRMEERHLEDLFPTDYPVYKQAVARFFPTIRNYKNTGELVIQIRTIRRIMIDSLGVLMIPVLEDLLELMHTNGVIPVLWHFP